MDMFRREIKLYVLQLLCLIINHKHLYFAIGDGEGAHVYILDTGIRVTHEEFEDRAIFAYDAMESAPVRSAITSH